MKKGLEFKEFLVELARQNKSKADYLVKTDNMAIDTNDGVRLAISGSDGIETIDPLEIGVNAHRQLASYLNIPNRYYDKMLESDPELLGINVNRWLKRADGQRMIRTLDGKARAVLSNRYCRIDNYDIANAVLPIIGQIEGVQITSCNITEGRMYIKATTERLAKSVAHVDDIVQAGVIITNSEVGLGAVNVQPLIYRLVCENGMVVNDAAARRNHIGRANSADENFTLYSDETIKAVDKAFIMKIQDTVRAAVDETRFDAIVEAMRQASEVKMNTDDVPGVVRLMSRDFGITESEESGILKHLIESNELSLYGLANAVTRYSQDVSDYDRATELEGTGFRILTMSPILWKRINTIAA